jgi:hypothetical protein
MVRGYIREKIKILSELCITLTDEQLKHLKSLTREIDVDNYVRDIITKSK